MAIDGKVFMLCNSTTEELLTNIIKEDWTANIKFDGERILAIVQNKQVILMNRRSAICNKAFPEIVTELSKLNDCILDGEIISLNDNFDELQKRALTKSQAKIDELVKKIPVKYMIFDILKQGVNEVKNNSLSERIAILKKIDFSKLNNIEVAEFDEVDKMIKKAKKEDREGVVLKHLTSDYESCRSGYWLKYKFFEEGQLEVIKYEINPRGITCEDKDGNRVAVLGEQSKEVIGEIDKNKKALVNIQFLERTKEGRYRFPSFRGLAK